MEKSQAQIFAEQFHIATQRQKVEYDHLYAIGPSPMTAMERRFYAGDDFDDTRVFHIGSRCGQRDGYRVERVDGRRELVKYEATHSDGYPIGTRRRVVRVDRR